QLRPGLRSVPAPGPVEQKADRKGKGTRTCETSPSRACRAPPTASQCGFGLRDGNWPVRAEHILYSNRKKENRRRTSERQTEERRRQTTLSPPSQPCKKTLQVEVLWCCKSSTFSSGASVKKALTGLTP